MTDPGTGSRRAASGLTATSRTATGSPATKPDSSKVTLQDVANLAGVSLATASRVLSDGPRRVGRQLAIRVSQAAAELGYTANLQARAVATGQSSMIGVVVHDICGSLLLLDRFRADGCRSPDAAAGLPVQHD